MRISHQSERSMDKTPDGKFIPGKENCWGAPTRRLLLENTTCRNTWLCTAVLLFLLGLTLVICGVIYQAIVVPLFLSGAVCILLAVPLFALYCWHTRCRGTPQTFQDMEKTENGPQVATVSSMDYYQQTPSGMKSDYPMGPLLVMTLPRKQPEQTTTFVETNQMKAPCEDAESLKSAISTTPDMLSGRKYPLSNRKNLPPLASAETLSPSLLSSHMSIDSVI